MGIFAAFLQQKIHMLDSLSWHCTLTKEMPAKGIFSISAFLADMETSQKRNNTPIILCFIVFGFFVNTHSFL